MILALWLAAACGSTADSDPCDGAPVVTWANFGNAFVLKNCQSCHASTAPDRYGAPTEVTFDTEDQTLALADRVLVRVVDEETMPPMGGVSSEDRQLLATWLTCPQ